MRYFEKTFDYTVKPASATNGFASLGGTSVAASANVNTVQWHYKAQKRIANPTLTTYNPYSTGSGFSSGGSGNYTAAAYSSGMNSVTFTDQTGAPATTRLTLHATSNARM
jgi:hypothetical protein